MASNLVLIGMPGAGKSTVGVLLAKLLNFHFVDTDLVIQAREGRRLAEIIADQGTGAFRRIEERDVLALDCRHHVIATGGSVVYSRAAMQHLKRHGLVVWLDLPLANLEQRLANLVSRGVVMEPGQTLADLYRQRRPLYAYWADITIDCRDLDHETLVSQLLERVQNRLHTE